MNCDIITSEKIMCKKSAYSSNPANGLVNMDLCIKDGETLREFTCDICKKIFYQMSKLKSHISEHLYGSPLLFKVKANQINGKEKMKEKEKSVLSNASSGSSFQCCKCQRSFSKSVALKIHLRRQHGILHKCQQCSKSFQSLERLKNHLSRENCLNLEETWGDRSECDVYGEKTSEHFKNSEDLASNGDLDRGVDKFDGKCDECGKEFNDLVELNSHVLKIHDSVRYECENCEEKFTSRENLEHHSIKENKCTNGVSFECAECGKAFAKRDYLKKHSYVHTKVLFKCKYCYCAFMKEKSYNRHVEKMNCSKSARKIKMAEFNFRKCRICQREHETEEALIDHFRESHAGENPHQCFCCETCLPTFEALQAHIHHHNIKKYTCKLCGKPYTSQEGFRKHRLKHKGAEFKCSFCNSEFLNESRFQLHVKNCKKNPETGYGFSVQKPKKKDDRPKQSRQLHWESRIIVKRLRGDSNGGPTTPCKFGETSFFDEPETEPTNERGWFDNYYKTEEDDVAFGLKKPNEFQVCEADRNGTLPENKSGQIKSIETATDKLKDCDDSSGKDSSRKDVTDSESFSEEEEEDEEESFEKPESTMGYNPKKCRLCEVTFQQEYELLHHFIKVHPNEKAHKCPRCEVQSPLFAQLKEHMKEHGIGMGIYNCDNCSKKFRNEKKMKSHNVRCKRALTKDDKRRGSATSRGEKCKKCGKTFHTKFGYQRHKQICKKKKNNGRSDGEKPKDEKVIWIKCKKESLHIFPSENSSEDKKEPSGEKGRTEEKGERPPIVPDANKEKSSGAKELCAVEPPLDSFPCRLCEKKFQYERGIVMHFKSVHPGHKPLVCNVCNMHLADKLKEHLKTHGIGEEFICELCGKRFNQKFLSKIHELWHQGVEYKCNNCKQKFLNREKMEKHVGESRCSNRQSLMRLPCSICGKSYRSKFGLNKHYITHTPKELRPIKNKMNCEYCGKWFDNNNGLQRHRRIHTGERPFCCRYCPKAFAQEGNCKAHERIHTGESKPRKKKSPISQCLEMTAAQVATLRPILSGNLPQPEAIHQDVVHVSALETAPYPGQISLYVYGNVEASEMVS